jgi:energy-coupling factor transport system ATP-binding protein
MVVLHAGRVAMDGPPGEVLAQDLTAYGLNAPPVARAGQVLGLSPLPLTVDGWRAALQERSYQMDASQVERTLQESLCPRPANRRGTPRQGSQPVIEVEGVHFGHPRGRPVLRGVDLTLYPGEALSVVGANGSGKTTLIKHLNGLYRPQQGVVRVLGQDTRPMRNAPSRWRAPRVSDLARHVGMAFQNANDQFFKFSVRDEVEAGARALGRYDARWMDELIALFDLELLLERPPYTLSEGQKKRVAFAAAMAARPEIVVLDEPTTGQDWPFRRALGELLMNLSTRAQTVVLVTHDLEFAEPCSTRWALLVDGHVAISGTPGEVMADGDVMRHGGLEPTQRYRLFRALEEGDR